MFLNNAKKFLSRPKNRLLTGVASVLTMVAIVGGFAISNNNTGTQDKAQAATLSASINAAPGQKVAFNMYYENVLDEDTSNLNQYQIELLIGKHLQLSRVIESFDVQYTTPSTITTYNGPQYQICQSMFTEQTLFNRKRLLYVPRTSTSTDGTTNCGQGGSSTSFGAANLPAGKKGVIRIEATVNPNIYNELNPATDQNYKPGDKLDQLNAQGPSYSFRQRRGTNGQVIEKDNLVSEVVLGGKMLTLPDIGNFVCNNGSAITIGTQATCSAPLSNVDPANPFIIPEDFKLQLGDSTGDVGKDKCTITTSNTITCTEVPTEGATANPTAPINTTIGTTTQPKGTANLVEPTNPVTLDDIIGTSDCSPAKNVIIGEVFTCTYNLTNGGNFTSPTTPITATVINQPSPEQVLAQSPACTLINTNTQLQCSSIPSQNGTPGTNKPIKLTQGPDTINSGAANLSHPLLDSTDDITGITCNPATMVIGATTDCTVSLAPGTFTVPNDFALQIGDSTPKVCTNVIGTSVTGSFVCQTVPTAGAADNATLNPTSGTPTPVTTSLDDQTAPEGTVNLKPTTNPVQTSNIQSLVCTPASLILGGTPATTNCVVTLNANNLTGGVNVRLGDSTNNSGTCTANVTTGSNTANCNITATKIGTFPSQAYVNTTDTPVNGNSVEVKGLPIDDPSAPNNPTEYIQDLQCEPATQVIGQTVDCTGTLKPQYSQPANPANPLQVQVDNTGTTPVACTFTTATSFTCNDVPVGTTPGNNLPVDAATGTDPMLPTTETVNATGMPIDDPSNPQPANFLQDLTCTPSDPFVRTTSTCTGNLKPGYVQPANTANPLKVKLENPGATEAVCTFTSTTAFTCQPMNVGTETGLKDVQMAVGTDPLTDAPNEQLNVRPIPIDDPSAPNDPTQYIADLQCQPESQVVNQTVNCTGTLQPGYVQPAGTTSPLQALQVQLDNTGTAPAPCIFNTATTFTCNNVPVGTTPKADAPVKAGVGTDPMLPTPETVDVTAAPATFGTQAPTGGLTGPIGGPVGGTITYPGATGFPTTPTPATYTNGTNCTVEGTIQQTASGAVFTPNAGETVDAGCPTGPLTNGTITVPSLPGSPTSNNAPTNFTPATPEETIIGPENIGTGSCTPDPIKVITGLTTCTFNLIGGQNYVINTVPPQLGGLTLGGVKIHTDNLNTDTPAEIGELSPVNKCTVTNNQLVCSDVPANGNLTPGQRYADPYFSASTNPPTQTLTKNKAPITLQGLPIDDPSAPNNPTEYIEDLTCDPTSQVVNQTVNCTGTLQPGYVQPANPANPLQVKIDNTGATPVACTFTTATSFTCSNVPVGTTPKDNAPIQANVGTDPVLPTTETIDVVSAPDDRVYLIPATNVAYNPPKEDPEIFGDADLTVTVTHPVDITSCEIKFKEYGNDAAAWQTYTVNTSGKTCSSTLPKEDQEFQKWDVYIRLTDANGEKWGTDPSYFMKHPATAFIEMTGCTIDPVTSECVE